MIHSFEHTKLWQRTLASRAFEDKQEEARQRLRNSYFSFRERVALLAAEIHRSLPDYTVHDITHLDALWEMADMVVGDEYSLTPTEAFVLGGSILLHDLGMGLASYPRGIEELKEEETWADTVTACYLTILNRRPSSEEINRPSLDIERSAVATLLRNLHAKHAEQLALIHWRAMAKDTPQFLIEDNEIRLALGRVIGRIAHSHWWPVSKIEREFSRPLGAPHWCPMQWVIDPLKLACILRLADASHIDARRAPSFLRALRRPSAFSDEHWKFQEKLQKPHLNDDAMTFTSGFAFPVEDARSWWVCLDTLSMIDHELRQVDALLADKGLPRFAARRIAGIESPERLVSFIPTLDWLPIDAQIQISDVPRLVRTLGAEELYGENPTVALRELIQNAADAIRVRRFLEDTPDYGRIDVRLGQDAKGHWLEIVDNGIGMSSEVLLKYLLDFGLSYWGSGLMTEEFPGLLSSGLQLTGKYGIGFFSVFMLGDGVRVCTRRADAARNETIVLEFNTGLSSRPILRKAKKDEQIQDGGTSVRVWLNVPPESAHGLLHTQYDKNPNSLQSVLRLVAPTLDVTIRIGSGSAADAIILGDDWKETDGRKLLGRLLPLTKHWRHLTVQVDEAFIARVANNLRLIKNLDGEVVGRACITIPHLGLGALTVGGLFASELIGIGGVLTGIPERASRDLARPKIDHETLKQWATEQASLVPYLHPDIPSQLECAQMIRQLRGLTLDLPIAFWNGKYVSFKDIAESEILDDELVFVAHFHFEQFLLIEEFSARSNVIAVDYGGYQGMIAGSFWESWPADLFNDWHYGIQSIEDTLGGVVIEALSGAWGVPPTQILTSSHYGEDLETKVVIGDLNSKEIKVDGILIRRPS